MSCWLADCQVSHPLPMDHLIKEEREAVECEGEEDHTGTYGGGGENGQYVSDPKSFTTTSAQLLINKQHMGSRASLSLRQALHKQAEVQFTIS